MTRGWSAAVAGALGAASVLAACSDATPPSNPHESKPGSSSAATRPRSSAPAAGSSTSSASGPQSSSLQPPSQGRRNTRKLPGGGTAYLPAAPTVKSKAPGKGCVRRQGLPFPLPPSPGAEAVRGVSSLKVVARIAPSPRICAPRRLQVLAGAAESGDPPYATIVSLANRNRIVLRLHIPKSKLRSVDYIRLRTFSHNGGPSGVTEIAPSG
jgi:hypothetical protein